MGDGRQEAAARGLPRHPGLNVAAGGSVHQDLAAQLPGAIKHDYFPRRGKYTRDRLVHDVTLAKGSRLESLLGAPSVEVNSMHHQGIKDLAVDAPPDGLCPGWPGRGPGIPQRPLPARRAVAPRSPGRARSPDESTLRRLHRRFPVVTPSLTAACAAPLTQPLEAGYLVSLFRFDSCHSARCSQRR